MIGQLPLHGSLAPREQQRVFQRAPTGKRKVIVSTNLAETAVTIDDVVYVLDTGLCKEKAYDATTNLGSLTSALISRASADQRKGRAGRTGPGVCFRLFTQQQYHAMAEFQEPELLRTPLEEVVLQVRRL